jgi:hypothetical protein
MTRMLRWFFAENYIVKEVTLENHD